MSDYNFRAGDIVTVKKGCSGALPGNEYVLISSESGADLGTSEKGSNEILCMCSWNWKLISQQSLTPHPMSKLTEQFALLRKKEPQKSFFKLGITDQDDQLTEEGQELFIQWLLDINEKEFNDAVVQPLLKEQKSNKK